MQWRWRRRGGPGERLGGEFARLNYDAKDVRWFFGAPASRRLARRRPAPAFPRGGEDAAWPAAGDGGAPSQRAKARGEFRVAALAGDIRGHLAVVALRLRVG